MTQDLNFTLSVRRKHPAVTLPAFIRHIVGAMPISSVFGTVEWVPLYGGRLYRRELIDADIGWMNDNGVGLRLPLTNHFITREMYLEYKPFLAKYHREGNAIITVRRDFAEWVAEDFPLYERELSVTAGVRTAKEAESYFSVFDAVIPLMPIPKEDLLSITDKSKIRLFVEDGCETKCAHRACYKSISRCNLKPPADDDRWHYRCARHNTKDGDKERQVYPEWSNLYVYDIEGYRQMGFTKFKVLGFLSEQVQRGLLNNIVRVSVDGEESPYVH